MNIKTKLYLRVKDLVYIDSINSGVLDLSSTPGVDEFEGKSSSNDLITNMKKADNSLMTVINEVNQHKSITFLDINYSLSALLYTLLVHETFHCGQMAAFCYVLNIPIPQAWQEFWAMPE